MDTPTRKRKREIQEEENDELSFVFGTCGLHLKRRKKTSKSTLPFPKNVKQLPQLPARFDHHDAQVCFGLICLLYVKLMSRRLFTLQIVFKIYFLSHLCPYICVELNATLNFFLVIFISLLFIDRMKKMVKIFHLHHLQIFHGSHQKLWIRQCLLPNLFEEMTHCGAVYKEGYQ